MKQGQQHFVYHFLCNKNIVFGVQYVACTCSAGCTASRVVFDSGAGLQNGSQWTISQKLHRNNFICKYKIYKMKQILNKIKFYCFSSYTESEITVYIVKCIIITGRWVNKL